MYKVFHENRCLHILQNESVFLQNALADQQTERHDNIAKIKQWLGDHNEPDNLFISLSGINPMDFLTKVFQFRQAAGGILLHENAIIIIERNGIPDLPKGHVEQDESIEDAAVREVIEETGLQSINLTNKLGESLHSYWWNDHWVLKQTDWYSMVLEGEFNPVPQSGEGISAVKKLQSHQLDGFLTSTYRSIRETLGAQMKKLLAESKQ